MANGRTTTVVMAVELDAKSLKNVKGGVSALTNEVKTRLRTMTDSDVVVRMARSNFGGLTKSVAGAVGKLAGYAAMAVGAFNAIKGGIQTIADFERANSELAAVLGTTTKDIADLTAQAKELGSTTEFTAKDVTALQISLARLGFNKSQISDMQESILKFSSAVGTDLASAADFTGSALRAFGLRASDSKNLLDIMAASTSKSALSFEKLQTSISIVGPVAASFGLSARDTVSLLGVLSNAGFDASSAATALRAILLNLADANGNLVKGLGYTAKTMPEIINALKDLRDRGIDLNSTLQMTDVRSVAAFTALKDGAGDVESLYNALGDADGVMNQMYDTMTNNLTGSVKNLQSAWEGLILAFGKTKGFLKGIVDFITDAVKGLQMLVEGEEGEVARKNSARAKAAKEQAESFWTAFKVADEKGYKRAQEAIDAEIAQFNNKKYINKQNGKDAAKVYDEWKIDDPNTDKRYEQLFIRTYGRTVLKNIRRNKEQAEILRKAKEELAEKWEEFKKPKKPEVPEIPEDPADKKDIKKAIAEYEASVKNAVDINSVFGKSTNDTTVRLDAMRSGIQRLITDFGLQNAEVQKLISSYFSLKRASDNLNLPAISQKANLRGKAEQQNKSGLQGDIPGNEKDQKDQDNFQDKLSNTREAIGGVSDAMRSLSDVVGEGAAAWLEWGANLLSSIASALPAIATLTAAKSGEATANAASAATGAASSVASVPFVGPALAVAAVAGIIASFAKIPKFANGGIAYGPTLGLFGEYAGASNNPEVVAPLNKLKSLIQPATSAPATVEFKVRGRDLYAVLSTETNLKNRN